MKQFNNILFDLDGTLTDSAPGILNAVEYALRHYGIAEPDRALLRRFIGPPLYDSFSRFYGFDRETALEAVEVYREYYNAAGIFENSVYPGVPEMLCQLKASGKNLLVATSKPEVMALQILEHFDLAAHFSVIAGATLDSSRSAKADVLTYALDRAGITDRAGVLMVGDREYDVFGAKALGLNCLGVLYGYGSREELCRAGADALAESPAQVAERILQTS